MLSVAAGLPRSRNITNQAVIEITLRLRCATLRANGIFQQPVRAILRNIFALEVRRLKKPTPAAQLVPSLRKFHIDLVLDVGANKGQRA